VALGTIAEIGTSKPTAVAWLLLGALFKHVLTPFFHCICIINILIYYYIAVLFTVAIHEPTKSRKPSQPLQFICKNSNQRQWLWWCRNLATRFAAVSSSAV